MKVILKEDVASLGKAGDAIKVADGYARNYLIPKGFAIEASNKNMQALEQEQKMILHRLEKQKKSAEAIAASMEGVVCTIARRVGDQEKLFGSVNTKDIESCLREKGFEIDRKLIVLEEQIKSLGEFPVKIKLPAGITVDIKVAVVAE